MIGKNGFLKTIRLKNFLSFGEDSEELELKSLNVLIGANASGKSNLIEALRLLRAAPQKGRENDIEGVLSKGGGISEWIWKGKSCGTTWVGAPLISPNVLSDCSSCCSAIEQHKTVV